MIPIPVELLEQLERGNVLLFIGERIVHDAEGRAVVDWLAAQLAARSGLPAGEDGSFPEAAQAYQDERGRQALVQFLRDELEVLGDEPQRVHHLIAGLTDCDLLVTTALDRLLERAFEAAGRPLDVIVSTEDVAFQDEHKAQLYKLRGSLEQVESLVLTEDDCETFFEDQASLSVVLQGYLARKTILFVGYDLADPHFKRLYRKVTAPLDHYARRAYAFGETPAPQVCRWCQRHGIDLVEADATAFLESLARQLAARARPSLAVVPPAVVETAAPLPERPYKLLDYFEARDAAIFFGRQGETQKLSSLIHAHRLVLLYGASGTGKTSLLLAGVVPRLEGADPPYETLYVRALEDPAQVIRRALRRKLPEAGLPPDAPLPDLLDAAARALGQPLVLVLDQFEEFFIRLSPEFRAAFIAELGALYDARDVPVKVVLSLREDWLAQVNEIEERIPEVFRTRMRLLPLTRDQAEEAITAPAERLGASYEPALVERALDDLGGAGAAVMPPQLQLVCSALYDGLGPDERRITLAAYDRLGGARGVLRQYLDDELGRLGRDEAALARAALEELVTSQGTKAVKSSGELAQALGVDPSELGTVLEKLVRARLLRVLERGDGGTAYELAHEYLIAEIALSPEAVARKEAEELLRQGVENRQRFGALLPAETFALIDAQRDRIRLDPEAQELMLRSALRLGRSVGGWLERVEDDGRALALAEEALLAPEGEPARQGLEAGAGEVAPGRLQALVGRLAGQWRGARGQERTLASGALWALRPHLPGGLRLQLALYRSRTWLWRGALLVVVAVVAVVIGVNLLQPAVRFLNVPRSPIAAGQPVTVHWNVANAQRVELRSGLGGMDPIDDLDPDAGVYTFPQGFENTIDLVIVASNMLGSAELSHTIEIIPKPEIEWVGVPAGEFLMGSDPAVDPYADSREQPQHQVYLDAYEIGRYEVTNAQYAQCVRATACGEPVDPGFYSDPEYADLPVSYVTWFDAQAFCEWVGGQLPTEAEWEKAARGTDGRIYPWGNSAPDCAKANYWGEESGCVGTTTPVGSYPAGESWCGAQDMAGNVWEWVADWYDEEYYTISPERNPQGPDSGSWRVLRGGSWRYLRRLVRSAGRSSLEPSYSLSGIGFRCARSGSEP